jgi:hypothetical protein
MVILKKLHYVDFSTGHMTQRDSELLIQAASARGDSRVVLGCTVAEYDEGFFISVSRDFQDEVVKYFEKLGMSEAFCALYRLCSQQGAQVMRFDRDGEIVKDLPHFDW